MSIDTTTITTTTVKIPQQALSLLREFLSCLRTEKCLVEEGCKNCEVWLVGGTVRDLLTNKAEILDLDLAISIDPRNPAKAFAREKRAGFVVLDDEREAARVVRTLETGQWTIDLTRFRRPTITEDLHERDFTINAIAVKLVWPLMEEEYSLYDPLGGVQHLEQRELIPCADHLFLEDPLRIMRAFRFAATMGFSLSDSLIARIRAEAHLLANVSGERIRDEFFRVLGVPDSVKWIRLMADLGVLEVILPELDATRGVAQNAWHHLDVFEHTLLCLENFEKLLTSPFMGKVPPKLQVFLQENLSGSRSYMVVLKFACLIHDIGKPETRKVLEEDGKTIFHGHEMAGAASVKEIAERLKLSSAEVAFLQSVVKNHMRPGVMVQEGLSDRRLFRFFSETGRDGIGIALLAWADRLSALGQGSEDLEAFGKGIQAIIENFYQQLEYAPMEALITGNDLITTFRLQPGPLFKEILQAVKEAQHLRTIVKRQEALDLVSRLLSEKRKPAAS